MPCVRFFKTYATVRFALEISEEKLLKKTQKRGLQAFFFFDNIKKKKHSKGAKMKNDDIGGRIKDLRQRLGLSLEKFGTCIDKSPSTVYSWEIGQARPKHGPLLKIAKVFGVSSEWLDTGAGPMLAKDAEVSAPKPPESEAPGGRLDIDVVTRIFNALTDEEQSIVIDAITTTLEKKAAAREKLDRLTDGQG